MKAKYYFSHLMFGLLLSFSSFVFAQNAAQPSFLAGEIFVRLLPNLGHTLPIITNEGEQNKLSHFPDLQSITKRYGVYDIRRTFITNDVLVNTIYTFKFHSETEVAQLIAELQELKWIDYAEKCPIYYPSFTPNDYNAAQQWHIAKINLLNAWNLTQGDPNIKIAIIDDAFNINHPDLINSWATNAGEIPNNNIDDDNNGFKDDVRGWDVAMNDNNPSADPTLIDCNNADFKYCHGTGVAGCAGASTNNGIGTTAPAFKCKLIPVKAKNDNITQNGISHGYQGIDYAIAAGARVVNMSWGGSVGSATGNNIIAAAHNAGVVLCGAAGNTGTNTPHYPAYSKYVISVAATNGSDNKAGFSTYNDSVDVGAPGVSIYTTNVFGTYGTIDGTSESSPICAGVCALMLSLNPCLTPDQIEAYLKQGCDAYPSTTATQYAGKMGAGRINAYNSLQNIAITNSPTANFSFVEKCDGKVQFSYQMSTINACPLTYSWYFPGGTPSSSVAMSPIINYPSAGTYAANLFVTNTIGNAQNTQNVVVAYNVTPNVNAGVDVNGCFNTTAQLNATVNLPNCTYTWTPSNGLSNALILNPVATLTTSTSYTFKAVTAAGCSSTDGVYVNVFSNPTTYAGADQTIAAGDSAQLQALGANTYTWSPSTGLSNSTVANPKASPSVTTDYTVTGTNSDGCAKTDIVKVTVTGSIGIDAAFATMATLSPIQPNPIAEEASIKAEIRQAGNLQLEVYDYAGKQVAILYQGKVNVGTFEQKFVPANTLTSGLYLLKWRMNGVEAVQKFMVK
ncbi:MAG: S8 family serine peptidase [Bacteroidia bacterium]